MEKDTLNEIYYQTTSIEANHTTVARIKQYCLTLLYLLWAMDATQIEANKEKQENTLDIFSLFAEQFFDELNEEVKQKTIEGLRMFADALEFRETN